MAEPGDWGLPTGGSAGPLPVARLLDKPLQLVRFFRAALASLLGGELERDGEELLLVPVDVRIQEREKMLCRMLASPFDPASLDAEDASSAQGRVYANKTPTEWRLPRYGFLLQASF